MDHYRLVTTPSSDVDARSPARDASNVRIEIFRFGELRPTLEQRRRTGLTVEQTTSLMAHPYARSDAVAVITLTRSGALVGRFGLIPGRVRIGAEEHPMGWGSDWYARDALDRRGGALLLLEALRRAGSVGACGVSPAAKGVLQAARFGVVRVPRRILVLASRPFLRRYVAEPLARALAVPVDAALALPTGALRRRARASAGGYELRPVDRFDDRVDALEERSRGRFWFPRGHRELNWALEHPWFGMDERDRYRAFHLHRVADEALVGYALGRVHSYGPLLVGSLLRWSVDPAVPDGVPALLARSIDALADDGVHLIELCTTRRPLLRAASRIGMLPHGHLDLAWRLAPDAALHLTDLAGARADPEADLGEGDMLLA